MGTADHLRVPRQQGIFLHREIDVGDGSFAHYLENQSILPNTIKVFSSVKRT
ncbi:Hypothetical protein P9303_00671 [Prochlorococcus marinus str. MIT 9303]|uniref:Uncharacterized protein n=1 Tax=Prochlorococcus marinus (strain MIT 9303) TaxID=59922 RepID=A2C5R4_PROM3|nr:Hypothetical protein P9303_00671 [Prochlorococcus marinus str. MIT 9303]